MLDQIESTAFEPLVGQQHLLQLPNGQHLPVQITSVRPSPRSRLPEHARIPFLVGLNAEETGFVDGPCNLEVPGSGLLQGVYVSRIDPAGRDPGRAYYQIIFG